MSGYIFLVCAGFMVEEDVLLVEGEVVFGVFSGLYWVLMLDNLVNRKFMAVYKVCIGKDVNVFVV